MTILERHDQPQFFVPELPTFLPETQEAPLRDSPDKKRRWGRKILKFAKYALGYTTLMIADNGLYYAMEFKDFNTGGMMVEDVSGCDPLPKIETDTEGSGTVIPLGFTAAQVEATKKVEQQYAGKKSATENLEPKKLNYLSFIGDWVSIHRHEVTDFTSRHSGADFHIYSDRGSPFETIDTEVIDDLMHASLSPEMGYDHIMVDSFMDCLHERFIDPSGPRELEGKDINIYVPSKPGVCWSNGTVQDFPEGAVYKEFCDSTGATYVGVRLSLWPYHYQQPWMVMMTRSKTPERADYKMSEVFIHESAHAWMQFGGLPLRDKPNEKLATYLEEETIKSRFHGELPESVTYPAEAYASFANEK